MNQNMKYLHHNQPKVITNYRNQQNQNNNAIQNYEAIQSTKELLFNQMDKKPIPKHLRSEPLNMGEITLKNQQNFQNKNNQQLPQLFHNTKKKNDSQVSKIQSIEQYDISSQTPQHLNLNIVPSFKPNKNYRLFNMQQSDLTDNLQKLIYNNSSTTRQQINSNPNTLPFIFQNRKNFGEKYNQKNIFDDDEYIAPIKSQNNRKLPSQDFNSIIKFEVKSLYNMSKLYNSKDQYLPSIVSIKTKEIETKQSAKRIGVDLICLIDRSSSMMNEKIDMVKNTLILLLDLLESQDRLQLIIFNDQAERLTPLICATEKNKKYFKQMIGKIEAQGGTLISSATQLAFQQLNQRKYKNNVNSIFLLSDGQDDEAVEDIQQQIRYIEEVFTLHTFGFGDDHDAEMMTQLCNLKNGSFYFVQEISLLDEFFADAFGGLISVIAEQIEISISTKHEAPFQDIEISKTYGQMWQHSGKHLYNIQLPQLSFGSRKDFVFEIKLPRFSRRIEDNQRNVRVIEAQLKLKDPITGDVFTKSTNLFITLFNSDEQINQNEEDIDVLSQFFRVKGIEAIDQARKACENNNFELAQNIIDYILIQIQKNKKATFQCSSIIQDLKQAKQASQYQQYHQYGLKQMYQLISNNYQQAGINSEFSMHGKQIQSLQPSYSNQMQQSLVTLVQSKKYPQSCKY